MAKQKILSEFAAAVVTGMSAELLRWFTTHAPKQGLPRKLKSAKVEKDVYFFDEEELLSFNDWLKSPWPHKDGKRPTIPSAIRREIRVEANGECAICQSHKDTCEAAHLDPVSKSYNNHPENLLWLCSNHHVAYDDGLFGPDEENADFVQSFKLTLARYKRMLWRMQHELSHKLFIVLDACDNLATQLAVAKTHDQVKSVEALAKKTIAALTALAPVSKADPKYEAYKTISADIASLSKDKAAVSERLRKAQTIRREYFAALGFVPCPLCNATGRHEGTDCPVCNGDREIEERLAEQVELSAYEKVDCPLCRGKGRFRGDDCPACGGDARMAGMEVVLHMLRARRGSDYSPRRGISCCGTTIGEAIGIWNSVMFPARRSASRPSRLTPSPERLIGFSTSTATYHRSRRLSLRSRGCLKQRFFAGDQSNIRSIKPACRRRFSGCGPGIGAIPVASAPV